mmetsp:Transcript_9658/g.10818  ORF Transcript_9658/g.10818 Transcript_9658/m.10818 type:complete len:257 (+) Transcript_9658:1298-2068(+)
MKGIFRIPLASYVRIVSYMIIGILCILIFGQLNKDAQSIQSRNGLLFFILTVVIMNSIQGVILIFPEEKPVFLREQAERLYSPTAYFIAEFISEIPMMMINAKLLVLIVYFATELNLNSAKPFFIFYGYTVLLMWSSTGLGFIGGLVAKDQKVAVSMVTSLVIPLMLVSGFFVDQSIMLPVVYPFSYISLFKWSFQVYLPNEYEGLTLSCSPRCDPVKAMDFNESKDLSIIITAVLGVVFYIIAYIILLYKSYKAK